MNPDRIIAEEKAVTTTSSMNLQKQRLLNGSDRLLSVTATQTIQDLGSRADVVQAS
jgi:hypothetical protein